ncbi:thiosulfate oxidation carrier protein SoxY [Alcaligenes sp. SDU_A2]|uniref:thiosulfate oxidation carrier protein SoxY n=1 Tax=Alcaligenes sp. SDU_A2 TaxID=3136634 RepID=UPI002CB153FF|nr:thiosulfate oxidation carrier protein SoxY [Alcaligenes sp.]HRL26642.1 thiosulfate oxidation carrier protein SoxY [Alcaligenes sp.]
MTFSKTPARFARRRQLLLGAAAGLGTAWAPTVLQAQPAFQQLLKPATPAQVQAIVDEFLQGAVPLEQGLKLEMPVLGDNPSAVPAKAILELPITPDSYCKELVILAEGNPHPLACRFTFTPLAGTTEVAVRLRLIETQHVRALARMSDGRCLSARHHITVTAGGCGM